jgi:hypothetical protein
LGLNKIINIHYPPEKTKQAFFTLLPKLLHHLLSNAKAAEAFEIYVFFYPSWILD